LWIVCGIIRLVAAVLLVIYIGTATVMFGALLTRVSNPFALMNGFHLFYAATIIVTVLAGLFGLIAGLVLLAGKVSARLLAIVASFCRYQTYPLEPRWEYIRLSFFFAKIRERLDEVA
jgi:hypothetical protein